MGGDPLRVAIGRLFRRVLVAPRTGVDDAELLERFVRSRDEAAIETLLWRHGPMVMSVCRRMLGNEADREDCFQAVFLVLCRKAAAIAKRPSLGCWLYKVAYRICLRARAARSRLPVPAAEIDAPAAVETVTIAERKELRQLLDDALHRLPQRYRAPLVLHYLEEKTVAQVAQELGWRPGTVSSRLARGKEMLRLRLAGRGWTLSAGAAAAALASDQATAALPLPLARATLEALFTGAVSQPATALAHGFLHSQLHTRLRWAVVLLVAVGAAAGGLGAILTHGRRDDPPPAGASGQGGGSMVEESLRTDADGDPLPPGAILRLGSARFRGGAYLAAYSPDGRILTTIGGGVRTWDAATGRPLESNVHRDLDVSSVLALSHDGMQVATKEKTPAGPFYTGRILVRRLPTLTVQRSLEDPGKFQARTACFSHDGKRLAADSRFDILVWDVATGKLLSRLPLLNEKLWVDVLALSPDGTLLAAVDSRGERIRLWDVDGAKELPSLRIAQAHYFSLAFSGDGKVLMAGAGRGQVHLWDAQTRSAIGNISIKGLMPLTPKISFDGKRIAALGEGGAVRLWDAATGQELATLQPPPSLTSQDRFLSGDVPMTFSPDGKFLVMSGGSPQIKIWDLATYRRIRFTKDGDLYPYAMGCWAAISPDGRLIATNRCSTIQLWDARTGQKIGGTNQLGSGYIKGGISFSADGRFLIGPGLLPVEVLLSGANTDSARWAPSPPPSHPWLLLQCSSEDVYLTRSIAAGRWPKWLDLPRRGVRALSRDGSLAAWAQMGTNPEGSVSVRDNLTGEEICCLPCPSRCQSVTFAPDGRSIAPGGGALSQALGDPIGPRGDGVGEGSAPSLSDRMGRPPAVGLFARRKAPCLRRRQREHSRVERRHGAQGCHPEGTRRRGPVAGFRARRPATPLRKRGYDGVDVGRFAIARGAQTLRRYEAARLRRAVLRSS
jgi:RNA polymerase sigma factor (sigma-70 family)